MNILKLTQQQLNELHEEAMSNPESRARKKSLAVYLRANDIPRKKIAELLKIDEDSITNYVNKYIKHGLKGLLEEHYRKPISKLESYTELLKKVFEDNPPHTINQAIDLIFKRTEIRINNSACCSFLRKIGLDYRRCGLVPGKANNINV